MTGKRTGLKIGPLFLTRRIDIIPHVLYYIAKVSTFYATRILKQRTERKHEQQRKQNLDD